MEPAMSPNARGALTESLVIAELLKRGFVVSLPFGNGHRYDLIMDDGNRLVRVQVKTGWRNAGCLRFPTGSQGRKPRGGPRPRHSYHGSIDIFMVYDHETGKLYRVPVEETSTSGMGMELRIEPFKKDTSKRAPYWASDYEFTDYA